MEMFDSYVIFLKWDIQPRMNYLIQPKIKTLMNKCFLWVSVHRQDQKLIVTVKTLDGSSSFSSSSTWKRSQQQDRVHAEGAAHGLRPCCLLLNKYKINNSEEVY